MIKIEKTFGVRGVENDRTLIRLQELIALSKDTYGWVGKVVIDTEKITAYKFGLKLFCNKRSRRFRRRRNSGRWAQTSRNNGQANTLRPI